MSVLPLAVTPGAWIFIAIVALLVVALILTAYTKRGSGIDEHPTDDRSAAPGAGGPTEFQDAGEELPGNAGTR